MNFVSEFQLLEAAVLRDLEAIEDHDRSAFAAANARPGDSVWNKICAGLKRFWERGARSNSRPFSSRSVRHDEFDETPRRFGAEVIPISIRPARKR